MGRRCRCGVPSCSQELNCRTVGATAVLRVVHSEWRLRGCQRTDHRQCHQETHCDSQRQRHGGHLCLRVRYTARAAALYRCSQEPHFHWLGVGLISPWTIDSQHDTAVQLTSPCCSPFGCLLCSDGFFGDKWDSAAQPDPNSTTGGWKICNHECGSVTEDQGKAWNAGKA